MAEQENNHDQIDVDVLIGRADSELLLNNGTAAELILREAYAVVYDKLTPLHLTVIEILQKLTEALEMQGKVAESAEIQKFIAEMLTTGSSNALAL